MAACQAAAGNSPSSALRHQLFPHNATFCCAAASSRPAPKKKVYHHPLSEVGGYQMPASGTIGGVKGVGGDGRQVKRKADSALVAAKAKAKKPVTKEEEAAVAAREAAKARVAKRTAQTFGFS